MGLNSAFWNYCNLPCLLQVATKAKDAGPKHLHSGRPCGTATLRGPKLGVSYFGDHIIYIYICMMDPHFVGSMLGAPDVWKLESINMMRTPGFCLRELIVWLKPSTPNVRA